MKIDIETLQDTFKIGYEAFASSRQRAEEVINMYHNRHYTREQLAVLQNRKQPAETFNVIKLFSRSLQGYFSSTLNTIVPAPVTENDIQAVDNIRDTMKYILHGNYFEQIEDKLRLDAMLTGLQVSQLVPYKTGEKDEFGRDKMDIKILRINPAEVVIDPISMETDYSDARFIHRFKWISDEHFKQLFGAKKLKKAEEYMNHLNVNEADFAYKYGQQFAGKYKVYDNYLVVHTEIEDTKGRIRSVYWCGDEILSNEPSEYKGNKFSYKVTKTSESDFAEYYGIFKDITESQKAINQALLQIQRLVNTNKVLVETSALPEGMTLKQFQTVFDRISSLVPVERLSGVKVENMSQDIQQQYLIIDNAMARIKQLLHINDSFLGMSFASDSGKKVKLQQNSTIIALNYLANKLKHHNRMIGLDLAHIISKDFNFTYQVKTKDAMGQEQWKTMNQPIMMPKLTSDGQVYEEPVTEEVGYDEETGTSIINYVNHPATALDNVKFIIDITTAAYNETDDADRLMLEQTIQGPAGQALLQTNPALYFKMVSMSTKSNKTRNSEAVADIFEQAAQALQQAPNMDPRQAQGQLGMPGTEGDASGASQLAHTMGLSNEMRN